MPLDHSRMVRCGITAGLVERTRTADPPVPEPGALSNCATTRCDDRRIPALVRAERVELSRACAHRILSPARLPFRHARMWTQPGSNRHASRGKRGALPLVLWAQGPGGSNRTTAGKRHAGYGRAPLANRGHRGGIGRYGNVEWTWPPIPNLAYYLVVNVHVVFADLGKKGKASPSRGGRSRTHVRRVGAGCPFRWTTPLRVFAIRLSFWVQEYKRAAPFRKRLLNELDVCTS